MSASVTAISNLSLVLAFLPALIVIAIMYYWRAGGGTAIYATLRMLVQLLLIGYVLIYIFDADHWGMIIAVLLVMLVAASWIAVRTVETRDFRTYVISFVAVTVSGVPILALVTQAVIGVEPWFMPRYVVPLAGMIFSTSMTAISIAAERVAAELHNGKAWTDARRTAFNTAMIPIVNSLFAVGLVSLPGMMTGQVLSGVSPIIAAKYQIIVMTMLFGATGIAAAIYLTLQAQRLPRS
jgi:putative ABC transport system permease protein